MTDKYKGYIAVDFDAVIATYERPFKYNVLGKPNQEIIDTIKHYYEKGFYIYIFTGRLETSEIIDWLKTYNVPYHSFNHCEKVHPNVSKAKPYYDCIIDDKAVNYHYRRNPKTKQQLIDEIDYILDRNN